MYKFYNIANIFFQTAPPPLFFLTFNDSFIFWPAQLFIYTSIQIRVVFTVFKHDLKYCACSKGFLMAICDVDPTFASVFKTLELRVTTFYKGEGGGI